MLTKCHAPVAGRVARVSSAQLAIEASERPLSSFATICAAGGFSRGCATSATIEWPSGPQASAGPSNAPVTAAANANDLMASLPVLHQVCRQYVTTKGCARTAAAASGPKTFNAASERLKPAQRRDHFLAEQPDRAQQRILRQVGEIELAHEDVEQALRRGGADFRGNRGGGADEDEVVLEQVIGVEQMLHDLRGAGLAAADKHLGVLAGAVLERLARLCRRQKAFVGAARPEQSVLDRFLVGVVDIDHRAIGNVRLLRSAGARPIVQEFPVARRGVGARIDQEIAGIDAVPGA